MTKEELDHDISENVRKWRLRERDTVDVTSDTFTQSKLSNLFLEQQEWYHHTVFIRNIDTGESWRVRRRKA